VEILSHSPSIRNIRPLCHLRRTKNEVHWAEPIFNHDPINSEYCKQFSKKLEWNRALLSYMTLGIKKYGTHSCNKYLHVLFGNSCIRRTRPNSTQPVLNKKPNLTQSDPGNPTHGSTNEWPCLVRINQSGFLTGLSGKNHCYCATSGVNKTKYC